jgi:hypothetical protein
MNLGELADKVNALLKELPRNTKVVGEGGEATVANIEDVKDGWLYQWKKDDTTYGMTNLEHTENKQDVPKGVKAVRAVCIR